MAKTKAKSQAKNKVVVVDSVPVEDWQDGNFILQGDELAAFRDRLSGRSRTLPAGFWGGMAEDARDRSTNPDAWERGLACARYLIKEVWQITNREDLLKIPAKKIIGNGLGGFKNHFRCSIHDIIAGAFPEYNIQPWEMEHAPYNYWQKGGLTEQAKAVKWWLDKEGLSAEQAYNDICDKKGMYARMMEAIISKVFEGRLGYPDMYELFHLIDPTLQRHRPDTEVALDRAILECPLCGQKIVRQLVLHFRRSHDMDKQAALEYIAKLDLPMKTTAELAKKYSLNESTIRMAARKGKFPVLQSSEDGWLIDETTDEFKAWVAGSVAYSRKKLKLEA